MKDGTPGQERSRARRARMTIQVSDLGHEATEIVEGSAEMRLALVETLTLESWLLTGRPLPACARTELPINIRPLRASGATS